MTESRGGLIISQLLDQMKMPASPAEVRRYARLRNFVLDIVAEGRRKAVITLALEIDAEPLRKHMAEHRRLRGEHVSVTAYIAKGLALAVGQDRRMQAYRLGRTKLVLFDDVDISVMVEREWDGEALPVFHIVRAAQAKSAEEINRELQRARTNPLGREGPMQAMEVWFFALPRLLRRLVWFLVRRNPYWFKDVAGTVGLTSVGMFGSGPAVLQPISPMTLTLSVGTIARKPVVRDGIVVAGEVLHLHLSADHAVIDGGPLMRFAERLRCILECGAALSRA